jgi:hypothetical protein
METSKNGIPVKVHHTDELAEILVRTDGIVEVQLRSKEYNKEIIGTIIATIKRLSADAQLRILVIAAERSQITLDGVKSLFSKEALSYSIAKAYVIKKNSHFVLAKVCMLLYQPTTPIRFFSTQKEAENWLQSVKIT